MPDESELARGAVWASVRITAIPASASLEIRQAEVGLPVCSPPEQGQTLRAWSIELHTERMAPAALGATDVSEPVLPPPKNSYTREISFRSAAALTHVKSLCEMSGGEIFTKAAPLPDPLVFMPGDRARIEIQVYRGATKVMAPKVEVFEEPVRELGRKLAQAGTARPIATPLEAAGAVGGVSAIVAGLFTRGGLGKGLVASGTLAAAASIVSMVMRK